MSEDYSQYIERQLTELMLTQLKRIADALTAAAVVEPAPAAQGTDENLCPSRYPLADGREVPCAWYDSITHPRLCSIGTAPLLQWDRLDPLARDATCTACKGEKGFEGEDHSDEPTRWYPCPTCKGTGVDETIPLHLVGVGSRLSREDRTDLIIVGKMDDIAFCVEPDGRAHQPLELAAIGRVWTVARAVPPAHTEATP
jgi:hypothetical protein